VPADSPIKSAQELAAAIKADPAKVTWAGGSAGGVDHIAVGLFAKAIGADPAKINYVPFKGGGESLAALLDGPDGLWAAAVRAAVLLGETGRDRADQLERLRALVHGETAGRAAADAVRKAVVETLVHGDRESLIASLDDALLGVRPRPAGYFAAVAS